MRSVLLIKEKHCIVELPYLSEYLNHVGLLAWELARIPDWASTIV